jgi:catechol 2,3-dioxygenase-like lactoylglutathione lyase family enzyme
MTSTVTLSRTVPALPARDMASAVVFYRDRLGFDVVHHEGGFAVVERDAAQLTLWEADDDSWRSRDSFERPVQSGAESFIAGTASCRIAVDGVDDLYAELRAADVLHPVSVDGPTDTEWGTREFAALDLDGNLLSFFERR